MSFSISELATMTPNEVRRLIRTGLVKEPTAGMCQGHLQGNLAILPKKLAYDFLLFAQRNPKSCPLLEVTDVGSYEPKLTAPGADIRTDVPKYRVYRYGELVEETSDITWQLNNGDKWDAPLTNAEDLASPPKVKTFDIAIGGTSDYVNGTRLKLESRYPLPCSVNSIVVEVQYA